MFHYLSNIFPSLLYTSSAIDSDSFKPISVYYTQKNHNGINPLHDRNQNTLLFYHIEPLKNGPFLVLPSSFAGD